jgi:4'-phosphopantetheinyl transferase EntD
VGSITHTSGYCAAVVASAQRARSVGIDAEPNRRLPAGVLDRVSGAAERAELDRLDKPGGAGAEVCWDRLLFSAKESVYKAWSPLTGRWLGFADVELAIDPAGRAFHATLLVDGQVFDGKPFVGFAGRFAIHGAFILTAVVVTRE